MSTLEKLLELDSSQETDDTPIEGELTYGNVRRVIELLRRVVRDRDRAEAKLASIERRDSQADEQTPARILRTRT
jgi:hypothetical protein